jgi:hypothetical protein
MTDANFSSSARRTMPGSATSASRFVDVFVREADVGGGY